MAKKKYEQLMDLLQKDIIDGKLPVGSRLPSERELAEAAHMNRMTVRNALKHLEESFKAYYFFAENGSSTMVVGFFSGRTRSL